MKLQRKSQLIPASLTLLLSSLALLAIAVAHPESVANRETAAQETASQRAHITILGTTDLHGNIYPIDYYTNKADNRGLAKIATLIKRARTDNPNCPLNRFGRHDSGNAAAVLPQQEKQHPA